MSAPSYRASGIALDAAVRSLASAVAAHRAFKAGAASQCVAAGRDLTNEVLPHVGDDIFFAELTAIMLDAGMIDFLTYLEAQAPSLSAMNRIADYGAICTARANSSTAAPYL